MDKDYVLYAIAAIQRALESIEGAAEWYHVGPPKDKYEAAGCVTEIQFLTKGVKEQLGSIETEIKEIKSPKSKT
jgi:hypothetical protein